MSFSLSSKRNVNSCMLELDSINTSRTEIFGDVFVVILLEMMSEVRAFHALPKV